MAKGDQEETMNAIRGQRTTAQDAMNPINAGFNSQIGATGVGGQPGTGLKGQQQTQLNDLTPRLQNFAGTGGVSDSAKTDLGSGQNSIVGRMPGLDPTLTAGLGTGSNSIANNIPTPDYSKSNAGYGDLAATGGVDVSNSEQTLKGLQGPNDTNTNIVNKLSNVSNLQGGVNDSISKLNSFGATGGMSDEDKANVLRPLFFQNEQTGGYTDQDQANIKKESNSVIPSYYSSLSDSLARQKASSGYNPGFSDANRSLMQQGAVASGDQALKTDINLADTIRAGKMDAAKAIQSGQLGISGITTPAKLSALQSAGQLGSTNVGQQVSGLEAAGGLNQDQQKIMQAAAMGDVTAQQLIQSGKIAGTGGLASNTTAAAQAAQAKAGLASSNAGELLNTQSSDAINRARLASSNVSGLAGMTQEGQQYGISGLGSLYNSSTNQLSDAQKMQIQSLGLTADQQARLLEIMQKNSEQPGQDQQMFGNILKGVGAASGAISGLR